MRLKTSSAENRKHPSRLRNSVCVEPGECPEIVENARVGIEFLVLILREIIRLHVVAQLVFALRQWLGFAPAV